MGVARLFSRWQNKSRGHLDGSKTLGNVRMGIFDVMFGEYKSYTEAESASGINIFESCSVDSNHILKFVKQDMDKVMEH